MVTLGQGKVSSSSSSSSSAASPAALTSHCPVEQLRPGLVLEPPEGCVGDPLQDTLAEDAPHHLLLGRVELPDGDSAGGAGGASFLGGPCWVQIRGGGRSGGAPHGWPHLGGSTQEGLLLGSWKRLMVFSHNLGLANHLWGQIMHANWDWGQSLGKAGRQGKGNDGPTAPRAPHHRCAMDAGGGRGGGGTGRKKLSRILERHL